ncbi:TPA: hypothetical protein CPT80_03205 [Candidatus Gastranaerophilales bacterium HUM_9]|nr:MAG TPA: hypothetical protein CPT80_03205 [Candidatus Gastranaerophilales bacterium HUM_9]HBX34876.1 hypothetical protein [Cyanobacteria bacterium UBA11440]
MSLSVSFKPMVSNFAPSFKSNDAKDLKNQLSELKETSQNQKMNDLTVMSNRMNLESKLNDTKTSPVQYVEDVKPTKPNEATKEVEKNSYVTAPTLDSTVKKFQEGKAPSKVDQDRVLTNQMSYMAVNNRVLHGLV